MPSSPTVEPSRTDLQLRRADGLLQVLERLPDPRRRRGVRHRVAGIVAVALTAVLAGARSYAAIASWAADLSVEQRAQMGLTRPGAPDASTFRRVLGRLDAVVLDAVVGAFVWTRTATVDGRRVIALDGKTVRGARTSTDAAAGQAPHLVSAFDQASGTVLGQLAIAAKSNEIPTVRTVLAGFDLTDVVVSVDAMHTQTDTAAAIIAGGGDYVFSVKANQPTLYAACKHLPWRDVPAYSAVQKGHGRRVRRTIKVLAAPAWITFTGAAQIAQIRRTVTRGAKTTVEVVYVITSADHRAAPPPSPGRLDPRPLGHREPGPLGPRRHLRRRQIPDPHRQRPPDHGHPPQHRDQPAPPRRRDQHRRSPTTPRPTTRPTHQPAADLMKHDFAVALGRAP